MAFSSATPPHKKRRLMPQSVTDYSVTPSPPLTPRYNTNTNTNTFESPSTNNRIPHVNSTPIHNYFARFTISSNQNTNKTKRINNLQTIQKTITPRTLWKNSEQIIPFPPTPLTNHIRKAINIDTNKHDEFYHPLSDIISNRMNLNVFNDSYFNKSKQYFDEQPFLHPLLQQKMRDDLFKLMCDMNDYQTQKQQESKDEDDEDDEYIMIDHNDFTTDNTDKDAMDILQTYGDNAITNILQNVVANNSNSFELADTDIERANQFVEYLCENEYSLKQKKQNDEYSSYNDMKDGMLFLGGVLEFITATILDSAGFVAENNNSITEIDSNHAENIKMDMDENKNMISQYDEDVFNKDVNINCLMIRPLHIRHAIADDDQLFWLQQAISTERIMDDNYKSDINDELHKDCVYHICSFFCGDLPMLSSLARVNTTFYAMTSSNNLWKPIAERCFFFNVRAIKQIEDNCNENIIEIDGDDSDMMYDFREYISLSQHVKLKILRERWIKQSRNEYDDNEETFEIFVRINPVYIDLHDKMYNLLYVCNQDVDLVINDEIYDLFRQLLEIFGTRMDFITISQIINNVKCFNYNQIKKRLSNAFNVKLSKYQQDDLNKVIEIEYNENQNDKDVLFLELSLSQNCFKQDEDNIDMDNDKHYLWIGKNIAIFAAIPLTYNQKLDL